MKAAELVVDEDFLEHYGVKGMKWGVTKEDQAARKEAGFTRLDNKPLNQDFLARWMKDA